MPVYYYPSGQYPTSTTQQYRPIASVQYNAQRSQQIPQTAQQAGIYVRFHFFIYSQCLLLMKLIGCVVIVNWKIVEKVGGCFLWQYVEDWETLCLDIPSNRRMDIAFSTTAVLYAVLCPWCSTWQGHGKNMSNHTASSRHSFTLHHANSAKHL